MLKKRRTNLNNIDFFVFKLQQKLRLLLKSKSKSKNGIKQIRFLNINIQKQSQFPFFLKIQRQFPIIKMSVLQAEPSLSISTNECKQQFLINQIDSMKATKDIYCEIFDQLKFLLKKVATVGQNKGIQQNGHSCVLKNAKINLCETADVTQNSSVSVESNPTSHSIAQEKTVTNIIPANTQNELALINAQINNFSKNLQKKVNDYCSSSISQNIVKYLEIEKQQHQFYPVVIHHLNHFVKFNEKQITQRQKQLQQIQDIKLQKISHNIKQHDLMTKLANQKEKISTQKTISSFDFNRRVMEVVKKQITMLKLRKRKLEFEIQQKKKNKLQKRSQKNANHNLHQPKIYRKSQDFTSFEGKIDDINAKTFSCQKMSSNLVSQQTLRKTVSSKNNTSAFQKMVMVYQKQKFLNTRIELKISKLKTRIKSQRQQNILLQQKTRKLQKQIQKLQWTKVCDSSLSFAPVHHKKIDKPQQLSILDRTFLRPYDQKSLQYSQLSINQSIIRKN